MGAFYRIYELKEGGAKKVAEIRDRRVTGPKAAQIRKLLQQVGFPHAPIEDVIDAFLAANPGMGAGFYISTHKDFAPKK